jgi:chemosensory pili system protein ChpC
MTEFLRCLLLSVDHAPLLLPYSAVAEVITYQEPILLEALPNWLPGIIEWRGLKIPLLSFAGIENPNEKLKAKAFHHIAIFNRLIETSDLKFFGMILNQMPRMLRFKRADINFVENPNKDHLLAEVMVRDQKAFIPNMNWIEKKVIEATATIAGPVGQST